MKNLLKLFLALFTGIALTLFVSCSDDDDTNVDDTMYQIRTQTTKPRTQRLQPLRSVHQYQDLLQQQAGR